MPWSPLDLILAGDAGGWFDPSDYSRAFQDAAGTVPVTTVAQPIGRLTTGAGAGIACFNLSQATASAQPASNAAGLRFGGDDWLDSGVSRFGRAGLFCGASESWTIGIAWRNMATFGTILARCESASKTFHLYRNGSGNFVLECRGASTPLPNLPGDSVLVIRWNGVSLSVWAQDNPPISGAAGSAAEQSAQRIIVGARTNGTGLLQGSGNTTARLFFLDRALSDADIGYLKRRLGEAVGLTIGTAPPEGGTSPVSIAVECLWHRRAIVCPAAPVSWSRRSGVQISTMISWQRWLAGGVARVTGAAWSRCHVVGNAVPLAWSRASGMTKGGALQWSRLGLTVCNSGSAWWRRQVVSSVAPIAWSRTQRIQQDVNVRWDRDALGALAVTAGVQWSRASAVMQFVSLPWSRAESVLPVARSTSWTRRERLPGTMTCLWRRHARVSIPMNAAWARQSELVFAVPEYRTLHVGSGARILRALTGHRSLHVLTSSRISRVR